MDYCKVKNKNFTKHLTNGWGSGIITKNEAERSRSHPAATRAGVDIFSLWHNCGRGFWVRDFVPRTFFVRFIKNNNRRCIFISTKETLINEEIKAKELRIVGEDGSQLGIMSSEQALNLAYDKGLDLVMMSAQAEPPVCRIMDYGKFRFEKEKREKEARKKQQVVELKEVQLSCRIDTHDFETKANHAIRFLSAGNKVRVVVKFRGREMSHMEIGREILERFVARVSEYGSVDKKPALEGRFMSMIILPVKAAK